MVRSRNLADFHRFALTLDLDPIRLMKRAGIHRKYLDNADLILPARAVAQLLEISAQTSGIPDFGLRFAQARGLPDFGPVILMLRDEATMRDALRTLVALLHLHSDAYFPHFDEGDEPIFMIDLIVGGIGYFRQVVDATVASLFHILRWLLGNDWTPKCVCFKHARPALRSHYDRFFRCPVDFLQDFDGFVLRPCDLDRKLPASSIVLRRQIEPYIRSINVAPSDIYVRRVKQVVAMAMPRGEVRAEIIARYLGTDCRTLNRRLARAGRNYSAVVDDVRKNLTMQYMLGSDRLLSDIAGLIGFGSLSAFSYWFRQSFDLPPSQWRKAQRIKQSLKRRLS